MKAAAFAILAIFLFAVPSLAQEERKPQIVFIPENISVGSAFVMLANLNTKPNEVVRISVLSPFYGHIPRVGNRFYCYFSNTDPAANCGPNPFTFSGEQQLIITVSNQSGCFYNCDLEPKLNVTIGGIEMNAGAVVKDTTAFVDVTSHTILSEVNYTVYNNKFEKTNQTGALKMETSTHFAGNLTLDYGTWWIAFYAQGKGGEWGSYLLKIVIGPEQLPEPVVLAFSKHLNVIFGPGESSWTSTSQCCIKNTLDKTVEIEPEVEPALAPYLSIELANSTLGPGSSTTYVITVRGLIGENTINTLVNLVDSNHTILGQLPINLSISVLGGMPTAPSVIIVGTLSITPSSWIGETMTGQIIRKNFTLTNFADKDYELYSSSTPTLGLSVDMPQTIKANSTISVAVTANYTSAGTYSGELAIRTKEDNITLTIPVIITVWANISSNIGSFSNDFANFVSNLTELQRESLSQAISSINSSITSASTYLTAGNYRAAERALGDAKAKFDMLQIIATAQPVQQFTFDPMIVVIPIVIVAIAIGGYFGWKFVKKLRKPKPIEKELEEEF
jgi:hypothetical protein